MLEIDDSFSPKTKDLWKVYRNRPNKKEHSLALEYPPMLEVEQRKQVRKLLSKGQLIRKYDIMFSLKPNKEMHFETGGNRLKWQSRRPHSMTTKINN